MPEVETDFLFEARVALDEPIHVGQTPDGYRMIINVAGGSFDGPAMRGVVLPMSGADWSRIRADGSGALDVRMILKTQDGALIYVHWHGIMLFENHEQSYALDFSKPDDPDGASRYYFRASPRFETADPKYAWLNNIVSVTKSRTGGGGVAHRVFAVR
ncbi:MAG: DUF3237 domain-containing protein [Alphaproteobacteria bacterium]|nr:DUF3237 domain-containing protein [Alphaproteobacteria bacterium]